MRSVKQLADLTGRTALVTGSGGHLGSVMAEALAEAGANLALMDISGEAVENAARSIASDYGVSVNPVKVDLASESAIRSSCLSVIEHFGRLDILVHSAAFVGTTKLEGWIAPFEEQSLSTWRAAMAVNLDAAFILAQACAPALRASGKGSIINIGSIYGMVGPDMDIYGGTSMGNPAAYAAGKGGLLQLTRWLSTVMAPEVRANMISFGGIERGQPEKFRANYTKHTPLGRMGTEEDAKGALTFLASDLSSYVTGHNLVVDGGWTAW